MASITHRDGSMITPSIREDGIADPWMKRISWAAILAGVTVTLAIQIVLSLLGAGIGFGMIEPATGTTPEAASFGTGAGIWWTVSNLVSLAAGGYTAAWLTGNTLRFDGMLHGIVTWGITLLLSVYFLTTAVGSLIGGTFMLAGNVVSGAGQAASAGIQAAAPQVAQSLDGTQLLERARSYLGSSGRDPASLSPEDAQQEIASALPRLLAGGQGADEARDRIVAIMAAQLQISPEEARTRFEQAQAQFEEARQEAEAAAREATDQAAAAAATGSYYAVAALLLGAVAAALGGAFAVQRRIAVLGPPVVMTTGEPRGTV